MLDRLSLVLALDRAVHLPAAASVKAEALYEKLIALMLVQLSLDDARRLGGGVRAGIRTYVGGAMTMADLKKLSKRWDPKRKIARETTQTELRAHLTELLDGRTQPYVPPPKAKRSTKSSPASRTRAAACRVAK